MSTRGCLAIGSLYDWKGVYNHFDSYPTGLGPEVWQAIKDGTYTKLIEEHPCGWSAFPDKCYCHDPYFAQRDGSLDPTSPHYREDAPDGRIESPGEDSFIEWVYVLDDAKLHVLHMFGAEMRPVASYPLSEDEPDWDELEATVHTLGEWESVGAA